MTTLLFVVAILHMGLGYALAVYLGHTAPEQSHHNHKLQPAPRPAAPSTAPLAANAAPTPEPEATGPVTPDVAPAAAASIALPAAETPAVSAEHASLEFDEPKLATTATLSPAESEQSLKVQIVSPNQLAPFQAELERYRGQLAEIDTRLRDCVGADNGPTAHECLRDLKQTNEDYVRQQTESLERVVQQIDDDPSGPALANLDRAVTAQAAEIAEVNQQLDNVDLDQDLAAGLQQMLDRALRLFKANQDFQTALDDTQLEVARAELSPEERTEPAQIENLAERGDFDVAVTALWQSTASEMRPLTIAVIDVDNFHDFGAINGVAAADRALHSIAQVVGAVIRPGDLATRFGGQRFVVLFPRTSARDATPLVERTRQSVGAARFQRGEEKLTLTVSCALTEAVADDTQEQLLARAESTLQEAKRYGRNRTFLHEGNYAAPVVPPRFTIESRVIEI